MNKRTTFPELLEYSQTSYFDEIDGEYCDNYFISVDSLKKCTMSKEDERSVNKGICPRCGNSVYELDIGVVCKDCGVFYLIGDLK